MLCAKWNLTWKHACSNIGGCPQKFFGFISQYLINLIFKKEDKDNVAISIFYWDCFDKTKFGVSGSFSCLIFQFWTNIALCLILVLATIRFTFFLFRSCYILEKFISSKTELYGCSQHVSIGYYQWYVYSWNISFSTLLIIF